MTHSDNQEIKNKVKENGLFMWQIADEIGISEPTLVRWMRYPLSAEKRASVMDAIKHLKERE